MCIVMFGRPWTCKSKALFEHALSFARAHLPICYSRAGSLHILVTCEGFRLRDTHSSCHASTLLTAGPDSSWHHAAAHQMPPLTGPHIPTACEGGCGECASQRDCHPGASCSVSATLWARNDKGEGALGHVFGCAVIIKQFGLAQTVLGLVNSRCAEAMHGRLCTECTCARIIMRRPGRPASSCGIYASIVVFSCRPGPDCMDAWHVSMLKFTAWDSHMQAGLLVVFFVSWSCSNNGHVHDLAPCTYLRS